MFTHRRMRSRAAFLAATFALAAIAGCGGGDEDSTTSTSAGASETTAATGPPPLVNDGQFTVCSDAALPPMEFVESPGQPPTGFDVDLAERVAESWGVELRVINTAFPGLLPSLSSKRCDVVWSAIVIREENLEAGFGAVPYFRSGFVIVVDEGNPAGISSPEDLSGKTVALQAGAPVGKMVEATNAELREAGRPPARVQEYPTTADATQQITVGRADATVTLNVEGHYRVSEQPDNFEIAYTYPETGEFGVYYRGADKEMGTALQTALTALAADGTTAELAERWGLPSDGVVEP